MNLLRPTTLVAMGAVAGALSVVPGAAQELSPDETVMARIIDHACLEVVEDLIGCENVVLLVSRTTEDAADLLILPDYRDPEVTAPLLVARDFVWAGSMFGQWPSVAQRENGSLVITAEQFGVGRGAWTQDMSLAWRDGRFVVAGLTRTDIDRVYGFSAICDVNLLTGDWEVSVATYRESTDAGRIEGRSIAASDWTLDQPLPAPCLAAAEQLYTDGEVCSADAPPEGCEPPAD